MAEYRVRWEIDVEADSPAEAAVKAQQYATGPDTTATVFDVFEWDGPVYQLVESFDVRGGKAMTIEEADELDCQ